MTRDRIIRLRREAWGFATGSVFFAVGAVPQYAEAVGPVTTNLTFVVGAVFFTLAALIQLALSGRQPPRRSTNPADRADWWAAAVQFVGTLCFNVSTTEALVTVMDTDSHLSDGWRPDAFGSVCFLVASGLAVVATRDRHTLWDKHARMWHGTWLNMVGSVFFALSAVGAYTLPASGDLVSLFWANLGTFLGALCFLAAALLSRRSIHTGGTPAAVS
ncbi:YrhK family protein [Rhodococcus maanshanensis]|uniref:YrhK-like protein n=1 Tax=Rhodococcus maanshanensis TaxID=183556 RepID=A0A1H7Q7H7_9NOCA|nr:YrhK family protein [Rhodococcus maanshanensis]SEL43943.1 YrhK-like protein [Rhodococcus maanshanensis]